LSLYKSTVICHSVLGHRPQICATPAILNLNTPSSRFAE
jgi:hypothetical protein